MNLFISLSFSFISYFCIPSPDPPSSKKKKKSPARAFRNSPAPRTPPPIKTCSDSPACPIEARLLDLVSATAAVHTENRSAAHSSRNQSHPPTRLPTAAPGRRHVARTHFLEFPKDEGSRSFSNRPVLHTITSRKFRFAPSNSFRSVPCQSVFYSKISISRLRVERGVEKCCLFRSGSDS